jgi:hypothetical protein
MGEVLTAKPKFIIKLLKGPQNTRSYLSSAHTNGAYERRQIDEMTVVGCIPIMRITCTVDVNILRSVLRVSSFEDLKSAHLVILTLTVSYRYDTIALVRQVKALQKIAIRRSRNWREEQDGTLLRSRPTIKHLPCLLERKVLLKEYIVHTSDMKYLVGIASFNHELFEGNVGSKVAIFLALGDHAVVLQEVHRGLYKGRFSFTALLPGLLATSPP